MHATEKGKFAGMSTYIDCILCEQITTKLLHAARDDQPEAEN